MKLILLLIPLLFLSCSGDDTKGTPVVAQTFNLPAWLQGTWMPESAAQQQPYSFTCKEDNVCYNAANTNFICWKEAVEPTKQNEADYIFEEHSTDSTYAVTFIVNEVVTSVLFKKIAADTMSVVVPQGMEPKGAAGVFVKR